MPKKEVQIYLIRCEIHFYKKDPVILVPKMECQTQNGFPEWVNVSKRLSLIHPVKGTMPSKPHEPD